MTAARATVVIPCLNNADTLGACLAALSEQSLRDELEIVVVDNGSTDASMRIATRFADRALVARTRGSAAARNLGLEHTDCELMLSLDSDCEPVDAGWAARHLEALTRAPADVLGSAGRSLPRLGSDPWSQRDDITPHPGWAADGTPTYAVAGNGCYRCAALRELGGFPAYAADDAALGIVASRRGLRFIWTPAATVWHANPIGWLGYARQMRKIGRYTAQLIPPPSDHSTWLAERARHLAGGARHLAAGRGREALAVTTAAVAQTAGARAAWREEDHSPV